MAQERRAFDAQAMEKLIEQRSQATARRLGKPTKTRPTLASQCDRARNNHANALKAWEDAGKPLTGPTWDAVQATDVDVFIYCEMGLQK